MDIAKSQQIIGNLAGIFFGLGLTLIIGWNCAKDPSSFQMFSHPAIWGGFGVFTSLLTMGFWIQLKRANQVVSEESVKPTNISSIFQFLSLITKLDQSAAQLLAAIIFMVVGVFIHFQSYKNGNWVFSGYFKIFGMGWFASLLLYPFLKNRFGTLNETPNASSVDALPSKWKGSFYVSTSDQAIKFILPMAGALTPDEFSISINRQEITKFKIIQTAEESAIIRARKIDGNLELVGKSVIEKAVFYLNPVKRPNHFIADRSWNPGDVMVVIEGNDLFYFLGVQNQYLSTLSNFQKTLNLV